MKKNIPKNATESFEKSFIDSQKKKYILRLYVTGATPHSIKAITNIKRICNEYLKDNFKLEIIDIYQQPQLTEDDQIIAAPTLIKKFPAPLKRLIGDMSDLQKVLLGLGIKEEDEKKN